MARFVLTGQAPGSTALTANAQQHRFRTVHQVLAYFVSRPAAVEGLEDVARWRLTSAEIARRVEQTDEAIRWLVDHGFLEQVETRAAAPLFRLNTDRVDAARALLASIDPGCEADEAS